MKSQEASFQRLQLGLCNAYVVQAQRNCILVDAGSSSRQQALVRHLAKHRIAPEEIGLIVITHVHFDHVGGLRAIKQMCRCPVAIHERESQLLRDGVIVFPPGIHLLGKVTSYVGQKVMKPLLKFPPVEPDILISQDLSLEPFGIPGDIVPTQGHTEGSLSVLLSSGEAFVGDLAANYLPFGLGPILPPFAENVPELLASWQKLLSSGATLICPSHGKPFKAELLRNRLHKREITS